MTVSDQSDLLENFDDRPPQFGLRALFWVVTGLCALFAVMATVGWMWSAMLLMTVLLVGGHIWGNSLGTSFKSSSNHKRRTDSDQS